MLVMEKTMHTTRKHSHNHVRKSASRSRSVTPEKTILRILTDVRTPYSLHLISLKRAEIIEPKHSKKGGGAQRTRKVINGAIPHQRVTVHWQQFANSWSSHWDSFFVLKIHFAHRKQYTRWFKYDRDWFLCKQAALRSSCATLREWSHNLHPPSCSG